MNIDYKDFERHLQNIEKHIHFENLIRSICRQAHNDNIDCDIIFPTMVHDVIDMLAYVTNDKSKWISYWVYELECGERYQDGMITDANGNIIKLKSIEDLWNTLNDGIS